LFESTNFKREIHLDRDADADQRAERRIPPDFRAEPEPVPGAGLADRVTPPCGNPTAPTMTVTGSFILSGNFNDGQFANTEEYTVPDQISWVHSSHNIRASFEAESNYLPFAEPNLLRGSMPFNGFPDFLLGLSAAQNGSPFSNVFSFTSFCGDAGHDLRVNDYAASIQDNYKVPSRLTINLGLRWDIYGQSSDFNGRLVNFWPQVATNAFDTNGQTFSGFAVPSNYKGTIPDGVKGIDNTTFAEYGIHWKSFGPRIGVSWQPGFAERLVLRGGFGVYYGRTSVNDAYQQVANLLFLKRIAGSGATNAAATLQTALEIRGEFYNGLQHGAICDGDYDAGRDADHQDWRGEFRAHHVDIGCARLIQLGIKYLFGQEAMPGRGFDETNNSVVAGRGDRVASDVERGGSHDSGDAGGDGEGPRYFAPAGGVAPDTDRAL
jgi:hypothetical protein